MDNNNLGILIQAKLDLQKSIQNINSDLAKLSQQVKSLNLNIDSSNLSKDINKQVDQVNRKSKGVKIDSNVEEISDDFENVGQVISKLKKDYNATSVSITRNIDHQKKQLKSLIATFRDLDGVTRKLTFVPTEDGLGNARYRPSDLQVIDDTELRNLKLAEEMAKRREQSLERQRKEQEKLNQTQAKVTNQNLERAKKEELAQKKKTEELQHQLQLAQRQATIDVQNFRRRYAPVITPEQNKQLDDYVANMNNLTATTPNVQRRIQHLGKDFKQISANVAEAGSRVDSFGKQLLVAMQRIPIWMIGMSAFYAPLRGIQSAIDQIIMLDSQMVELRRVMDATPQTYNQLMSESIALATELGNRVEDVNQAMVEFARQGYDPSTLIALTETATVAANISELTTTEAMSSLTAAMKSFNIEANDSITVLDRLNEVDNNFAISTKTISDALERSSSTANTFSIDLDELIGLISAIGITTRESGSVIGRAIADVKPFLIDLEILTSRVEDDRAQAEFIIRAA